MDGKRDEAAKGAGATTDGKHDDDRDAVAAGVGDGGKVREDDGGGGKTGGVEGEEGEIVVARSAKAQSIMDGFRMCVRGATLCGRVITRVCGAGGVPHRRDPGVVAAWARVAPCTLEMGRGATPVLTANAWCTLRAAERVCVCGMLQQGSSNGRRRTGAWLVARDV